MRTTFSASILSALLIGLTIFTGRCQTTITLNLIHAENSVDSVIQSLNDGDTLDLNLLPTDKLNIEALASAAVGIIDFDLINNHQNCEGVSPYALFGDYTGNFNEWTPAIGSYTLNVKAFSGSCINPGNLIADTMLSFLVINSALADCNGDPGGYAFIDDCGVCAGGNTGLFPNANKDTCGVCFGNDSSCLGGNSSQLEISLILINADADTAIRTLTDGDTMDLSNLITNDLNIQALCNPDSLVESVEFVLNGTLYLESAPPYALFGDNNGNFNVWVPSPGTYSLTIRAYNGNNGNGSLLATKLLNIVFVDSSDVDCYGDIGGTAYEDDCGVCVSGNTGILPNLDKDTCGVCFGNNTACVGGGAGPSVTPSGPICGKFPGGRIAMSSDGNNADADDHGATAFSIAMLYYAGLLNQLVYVGHSSLYKSPCKYAYGDWCELIDSASVGALLLFGADTSMVYSYKEDYDDNGQLDQSITAFTAAIEASSPGDSLWIYCAGPMDVVYRAIDNASPAKRAYVKCISHSSWNETSKYGGLTYTWADLKNDFIADGVQFYEIRDQNNSNGNLDFAQETDSASHWDWMTQSSNPIWTYIRKTNLDIWLERQKNKAFDISDAGMMYWLISGGPDGGCDTCGARQLEYLFNNPCQHATANLEVTSLFAQFTQDTLRIDSDISYNGDSASANFKVGFFASHDETIDTNDIFLGDTLIKNMVDGDTTHLNFKKYCPHLSLPNGYLYKGAIADYKNELLELDKSDNAKSAQDSIQAPCAACTPDSSYINHSICQGSGYRGHTTAGLYVDSLFNSSGCDSLVYINLSIDPILITRDSVQICFGESHAGFNMPGAYTDSLVSQGGCDSIHTLHLTVNPVNDTLLSPIICDGEQYLGYSVTGFYIDTLISRTGCDSICRINLNVLPTYATAESVWICQGETYRGFLNSGTYIQNLKSLNGCDSTHHINLSVLPPYDTTITASICQGTSMYGYSIGGLHIDTLQSQFGCDSIRKLNLNVIPVKNDTLAISICKGDHLLGYTNSGIYTDTLQSFITGCDSIFTLELWVNESFDTSYSVSICRGGNYNGLHTPGTYTDSLLTKSGCDSVLNFSIQYLPPIHSQSHVSICPGDTFRGFWSTGTYTDTLITAAGCDSVHTFNIQLFPNQDTSLYARICPGDSIFGYSSPGTYIDTLQGVNGCDSIRQLNITMLNNFGTTMNVTICHGQEFAGYTSSGTYLDVFRATNGCDSTRTLNLSVYKINTSVSVSNFTLYAANSSALSYQWFDCILMKPIPAANSLSYKPLKNGEYAVIIDQAGCTDTSDCVEVRGIDMPEMGISDLKLYPNPTQGYFVIELPFSADQIKVRINDTFGKKIFQDFFTTTREINIEMDQPEGVYFVEIEADGRLQRIKLIMN